MTPIPVRLATTQCNILRGPGEMNLVERHPQSGTRYSVGSESHLSLGNWIQPAVFTTNPKLRCTVRAIAMKRQAVPSSDSTYKRSALTRAPNVPDSNTVFYNRAFKNFSVRFPSSHTAWTCRSVMPFSWNLLPLCSGLHGRLHRRET
jgi:hypothetical protein